MADAVAADYFSRTFALWIEETAQDAAGPAANLAANPADRVFDEFALPLDAAEETIPLIWSAVPLLDAAAEHWWGEEAA